MKTITEKILDGVKETLQSGEKVTIDLREAASLGGSGDGQGGRTYFDDAFAALRYANPFRIGARQIKVAGSSAQFVAKTGNAANQTNPWGYTFSPNTGTPGTNTTIWQLPTRVITAQLPIRTAAMSDINYLNEAIVEDLMLEFSAIEAASMASNNDQAGSTTTTTGGTDGLRGLNYYPGAAGASAAYGSSGVAITNGLHTLTTIGSSHTAVDIESLQNMAGALPPQYWSLPGTAWHMHPTYITAIRAYAHNGGTGPYSLVETGELGEGPGVNIMGFPVVPNPYLNPHGTAGNIPVYLANWPQFLTITDVEEMTIQAMEETTPGFIVLFAEKRMVSTVRDPFAGVRLIET
jgi:HK97 family phage major capsid protein